jgi:hypothetical protein
MTPLMPAVKNAMVRTLSDALDIVRSLPERHDCPACDRLINGRCTQWNAVPPPEVQPVGCDAFVSTVPF